MVVYDLSEGISRRRHDDMTRGASCMTHMCPSHMGAQVRATLILPEKWHKIPSIGVVKFRSIQGVKKNGRASPLGFNNGPKSQIESMGPKFPNRKLEHPNSKMKAGTSNFQIGRTDPPLKWVHRTRCNNAPGKMGVKHTTKIAHFTTLIKGVGSSPTTN